MVGVGDRVDTHDGEQPPVRSVERDEETRTRETEVPLAFPERDPDSLSDTTELYLMRRHAADDGSVTVQVLGWERDDDIVRVEYSLPTGARQRDRYRWPTPGRYEESDFIGLVRRLGYAPGSAEHIAGEFARARHESGRWRIVTGRETRGGRAPRTKETDPSDATATDSVRLTGRFAPSFMPAIRARLEGVDPMDLGMVSVLLAFLSVVLPAAAAVVAGGLTATIAALGALLFGGAVVSLWLSIVIAAT